MNLKNIWKNTYLGKLLSSDPIFGRMVSTLVVIYLFIHIFRLEMYPLYMFAMFSKQEMPREYYHAYKMYDQNKEINLEHWDYRKYTVLMNTIGQYDDILQNDMSHPEAQTIDKFINRLKLNNTGIKSKLKGSFKFTKTEIQDDFGRWIGAQLKVDPEDLRIEKNTYKWDKSTPNFESKTIIHGVD